LGSAASPPEAAVTSALDEVRILKRFEDGAALGRLQTDDPGGVVDRQLRVGIL
jgi:hypothetical protein